MLMKRNKQKMSLEDLCVDREQGSEEKQGCARKICLIRVKMLQVGGWMLLKGRVYTLADHQNEGVRGAQPQ